MKLGVLSQWYDPEPGGGAVAGVLASGLVERGHDVKVLTGFPNYPTGIIYPGYSQRWRYLERPQPSLTIRRAPLLPSHDSNPVSRATNYLSFGASATTHALGFLKDRDALWVYNSPAPVGAAARQLRKRRGVPYLLHVMDMWPDSVLDSGMLGADLPHRLAQSVLGGVVRRTHETAALIAVTSPGQLDLLRERGVPEDKLRYIPVWANEQVFHPRDADRSCLPQAARTADTVLMYAGAMGHVQNLDTAVRAAAATGSALHLVMVGTGTAEPSLKELAHELKADNVHFMGPQPPTRMGEISAAADVHLVSLADTPLLRVTMPSKIQSIMALGRPIVATCAGDAARLVEAGNAGIALPPGDEARLRDALSEIVKSPDQLSVWGQSARRYYEAEFARTKALARVEQALETII